MMGVTECKLGLIQEGLRHAQEARRLREHLQQLTTPQGAQVRRGGTRGGTCLTWFACGGEARFWWWRDLQLTPGLLVHLEDFIGI